MDNVERLWLRVKDHGITDSQLVLLWEALGIDSVCVEDSPFFKRDKDYPIKALDYLNRGDWCALGQLLGEQAIRYINQVEIDDA